jgi:hypothetical protein
MHGLFKGYHHQNKLDISKWDVSNVEDMSEMFYGTLRMFDLDISKWNTHNVKNM